MSETSDFINQIINNALTTAQTYTQKVSDTADDLISANGGVYIPPPSTSSAFSVEAEEPDIPEVENSALTYEAQLDKLITLLSGQLGDFFATYYPLQSDAFDEAQAWLVDVITNGGTGINAAVEDAVWQRARDRVIADGRRVEEQIATGYAAKGYFIPPGSMLKKIEQSRFKQASDTGIASTTIAAKQIEIEIETVKFAIGKAIDSRTMAMNAAADYIRAIASSPDAAARVASLNTDAKARMMSAAGDFYRARLSRDEIVLRSKLAKVEADVDVWKMQKANATDSARVDTAALAAAADSFARAASAALSSLNSIVSTATNAFA